MSAQSANEDQTARWNGAAGHAWVDMQDVLDRMFEPFAQSIIEPIANGTEARVLDVGCGTGATSLAIARRLGSSGHAVGVDISEPMIAAAQRRAGREGLQALFIRADAQTYTFDPASFDWFVSRFGVMFFDDPVAAFTNLRRAARQSARLRFIAWRSTSDNPFMTTAERAAGPYLPDLPARRPDEPGQFAFADADKVRRILDESGWNGIDIQPLDVQCTLPEADLLRYVTRLGPLGLVIESLDERPRTEVVTHVRAAFEPYVYGPEVRFTAACWLVDARA